MIMNSITYVLQSVLQYIALIAALLLYRWIKDVFPFSDVPYTTKRFDRYRHILKGHRTRSWIRDEPLVLYQWIRQLRWKHNLTQEELAEKIGVDPRTVQRWENGETRPQPRHYGMFQQLEQDIIKEGNGIQYYMGSDKSSLKNKSYGRSFWIKFLILMILVGLVVLLSFIILRFWLHFL